MTSDPMTSGPMAPRPGEETARDRIKELVLGTLPLEDLGLLQRESKTGDRGAIVLAIEQERVSWDERILVPLQEHLYVVERADGARVVKCECGYEFGDYRRNWKEEALVYERPPQDGVVFQPNKGADPQWQALREFYCPGCATQLDVEPVPVGYPFVFNFLPDLDD
jgi:acetone carboxylase gamma subunit